MRSLIFKRGNSTPPKKAKGWLVSDVNEDGGHITIAGHWQKSQVTKVTDMGLLLWCYSHHSCLSESQGCVH